MKYLIQACFLLVLIFPFLVQAQITAVTKTPLMVLGESNCRALDITPNDDALVMAVGKDVLVWGMENENISQQLKGHEETVTSVAVSSSGRFLATGSADHTIKLWNLKSSQIIRTFKGHEAGVSTVDFSPDEQFIVSGSFDKTAKIWNTNSNTAVATLVGHSEWITDIAFSPNGNYVLTSSADRTARLWNILEKVEVATYPDHLQSVTGVVFSPNGLSFFTIANDSQVRKFGVNGGNTLQKFSLTGRALTDIAISPDGKKLAVSNSEKVTLFDLRRGKKVLDYLGHKAIVNRIVFTNNNDYVLSSALDKTVQLWDVDKGVTFKMFLEKKVPYNTGIFNVDQKSAITGTTDGKVQVWSVQTGNATRIIKAHEGAVSALAVSKDGGYLLSGSVDKSVKLWNLETATLMKVFAGHKATVTAVAFTGKNGILTVSEDRTIRLWDIASGSLFKKVKGHQSFITGLDISPNGKHFVTCSEDLTVKIWDIYSLALIKTIKDFDNFIINVKYTPDGKSLLTTTWDNEVKLLELSTSKILHQYEGHVEPVTSMDFSPDGQYMVTASKDHSVRLWDVNQEQVVEIFDGHKKEVTDVDFSNDGQYILTTSKDNQAKIWLAGMDMLDNEVPEILPDNPVKPPKTKGYIPRTAPIRHENITLSWHTPSGRRYRGTPYLLNDDFLNIEIEIESKELIDERGLTLLMNNRKGAKFSETSLQNHAKDAAGIFFYSYKNKVKFAEGGRYYLQLEYSKDNKILCTSEVITIDYEPEKINLYLLSIGTNPVDLKFPTKDAADFATLFENHSLFKKVYTRKLIAEEATATRIKLELSKLKKNPFISERDIVMVFLSSHGFIRQDGNFSIQASDYDLVDPNETSIAFNEITERLNALKCKKILFMDACHSGVASPHLLLGRKDNSTSAARAALQKLLVKKDGWLMITSSGDEPSWEHENWQNGSFTEAIVEALGNGAADVDGNNLVSIQELYNYLKTRVSELNTSVDFPSQSPQITNTLGNDLEFFQIKN